MPEATAPSGSATDPHSFAEALGRVGVMNRRGSRASVSVAAALLADGEFVQALVIGRVYANTGIAILTNTRLLIVNDREFKPDLVELALAPPLIVEGWQDDRSASLTFRSGDFAVVIDSIRDRELALGMAAEVRARVG